MSDFTILLSRSGRRGLRVWIHLVLFLGILLGIRVYPVEASASFRTEMTLTTEDMQKFDKGRVISPVTFFRDGGILLMSESEIGGDYRLLWVGSRGRFLRKMPIPLKKVEYLTASPDGNTVVAYSSERFSFLVLRHRARSWEVLASRQGALPGFALYGGKKSRLFYSGKDLYAVGYFYDRAGEYVDEALVRIDTDKKGDGVFEEILRTSRIDPKALALFPGASSMSIADVSENHVILRLNRERDGALLGYDIGKKEYFLIDRFTTFSSCTLSPSGTLLAYTLRPRESSSTMTVLFVYDMEKRITVNCIPGMFFNPVFDRQEKNLAVGRNFELPGNVSITQIAFLPLTGEISSIFTPEGSEKVFGWSFTSSNSLTVFSDRRVFRIRISGS